MFEPTILYHSSPPRSRSPLQAPENALYRPKTFSDPISLSAKLPGSMPLVRMLSAPIQSPSAIQMSQSAAPVTVTDSHHTSYSHASLRALFHKRVASPSAEHFTLRKERSLGDLRTASPGISASPSHPVMQEASKPARKDLSDFVNLTRSAAGLGIFL